MTNGLFLGLATALLSSCAFLFSRRYAQRYPEGAISLTAGAHITMGIFSLLLLALVWPAHWPAPRTFALPLAGTALFYLAGQMMLFVAFKKADASRISPLLGIKLIF
jgi:drug/metabolite transporter (DMT)-like permease